MSGLRLRAGVLTGEAAVTLVRHAEGMVAGDLVNTASRLQSVAQPGSVLVGESTYRAASGAIAFEPVGDQALKGKTAAVPAWRAVAVVAKARGVGRSEHLEPPFVGRDAEFSALKERLHATSRDSRTRLVSIVGAAGIGKSPPGLGIREIPRRRGRDRFLASRPLARVRRRRRILGAGRDGPPAGRDR